MKAAECPDEVRLALASLRISLDAIATRRLVLQPEAVELVLAETDEKGRQHLLVHSGRAIDVTTGRARSFDAEFDDTEAFRWLSRGAQRFGWSFSFPRDNPHGYAYEPWHWCFAASGVRA
jgi:D-alanyl-D-alanine carboxypeptidase